MTAGLEILKIARAELGQHEVEGPDSNPRVLEYMKAAGYEPANGDDDPWCGCFAGWVMVQAGYAPPVIAARARAWLDWGMPIDEPVPGCIAVWPRGTNVAHGHVNIVDRIDGDNLHCLGGNQGNAVSSRVYDIKDALGFRWPIRAPLPIGEAPRTGPATATGAGIVTTGVMMGPPAEAVQTMQSVGAWQAIIHSATMTATFVQTHLLWVAAAAATYAALCHVLPWWRARR